jgi:hypothetical protein
MFVIIDNKLGGFASETETGGYAIRYSSNRGTPAFVFKTLRDAEGAFDTLPHGTAKNCRIVELRECAVPA